jgi:hypothetical protein
MMTRKREMKKSIGDRAVDGLLAGIVAGVVMLATLLLLAGLAGRPVLEVLAAFDITDGSVVRGLLLHLATAGIYGILFAAVAWQLPGNVWPAAGAVYGLLLWLLARGLLLPLSSSALATLPPLALLASHLVYGLALSGWLWWGRKTTELI